MILPGNTFLELKKTLAYVETMIHEKIRNLQGCDISMLGAIYFSFSFQPDNVELLNMLTSFSN